jgi:hypothetical protein
MFKNAYKERKQREMHSHAGQAHNLNFIKAPNQNNPRPFQSSPIMGPTKLVQPVALTQTQIRK